MVSCLPYNYRLISDKNYCPVLNLKLMQKPKILKFSLPLNKS